MLASPDRVVRRVARDALAGRRDIVVAADACDLVELLELARFYRPELVLVDLALPREGGIAATEAVLAATRASVAVLAPDRDDRDTGLRALLAGARGFISLAKDADTLAATLLVVAHGEVAISPRLTMHVVERLRTLPDPRGLRPVRSSLTGREWEVLDLLTVGYSTLDIARTLLVTPHTVYGHIKRILRKLGVRTRAEAVNAARELRHPVGV